MNSIVETSIANELRGKPPIEFKLRNLSVLAYADVFSRTAPS